MAKTAKPTIKPAKSPRTYTKRVKDHDIFVRGILSINELVLKLLRRYLPLNVQPFVDFDTLKSLSDMHVDNKLKASQSDSIHECALKLDKLPPQIQELVQLPKFRFCFLWEHKSGKPNEPIEMQIERYRYSLIRKDLKNGNFGNIIIPILLYHGKEKWDKKLLYEQYQPFLPTELLAFIPYPKYIVIDIQAMSQADIEAAVDLEELRAAFIALKYGFDRDFFKANAREVLKFVKEMPTTYLFQEFFKMLIEYVQRRSDLEKEEIDDIVEQNLELDMPRKVFRTTFEVVADEAEARGKAEGKAEGIQKKDRTFVIKLLMGSDFDRAKIARFADVTEAFVEEMREVLNLVEEHQRELVEAILTTEDDDAAIAQKLDCKDGFVAEIRQKAVAFLNRNKEETAD